HAACCSTAHTRRGGHDQSIIRSLKEPKPKTTHGHPPANINCPRIRGNNPSDASPDAKINNPREPSNGGEYLSDNLPDRGAMIASAMGHGIISNPISIGWNP